MQTLTSKLRTLRPASWLSVVALATMACTLPLVLRARASGQDSHVAESGEHDCHDHTGDV